MQTLKKRSIHPILNRVSQESKKQLKLAENYIHGFYDSQENLEMFDFEYHLGLLRHYGSFLKKNWISNMHQDNIGKF